MSETLNEICERQMRISKMGFQGELSIIMSVELGSISPNFLRQTAQKCFTKNSKINSELQPKSVCYLPDLCYICQICLLYMNKSAKFISIAFLLSLPYSICKVCYDNGLPEKSKLKVRIDFFEPR